MHIKQNPLFPKNLNQFLCRMVLCQEVLLSCRLLLLDFPILADYALVADNGKRLFLTHGHVYNEEKLPKGKHDYLFYGHTHLWKLEKKENMVICNTGSVTFPKGGNVPTFAIFEDGKVSIYAYCRNSPKPAKLHFHIYG